MKPMTDAQRSYEQKRAAKAGMSLEKWMADKAKQAAQRSPEPPKPAKSSKAPGFLSKLLERANKPL